MAPTFLPATSTRASLTRCNNPIMVLVFASVLRPPPPWPSPVEGEGTKGGYAILARFRSWVWDPLTPAGLARSIAAESRSLIMTPVTLYTIGHGDRPIEAFLDLLRSAAIHTLVDIRARPRSNRHPQYDESTLRQSLSGIPVVYHWAGRQLGGFREPQPASPHTTLSGGFRGFADHMDTPEFARAASQLLKLASRSPSVMMCAEMSPEECHRRLLADYLLLQGATVIHLLGNGEQREHVLHPQARRESAALIYGAGVSARLPLGGKD